MLQYLFDTDHLTLYHQGCLPLGQRMAALVTGTVGLSIVAVEEALRGRLSALAHARNGPVRLLRYALLHQTIDLFPKFPVVPYSPAAETQFQHLLSLRIRIGTQDLKIAAIALANNLILLTRNRRDFGRVPALTLEDWSV